MRRPPCAECRDYNLFTEPPGGGFCCRLTCGSFPWCFELGDYTSFTLTSSQDTFWTGGGVELGINGDAVTACTGKSVMYDIEIISPQAGDVASYSFAASWFTGKAARCRMCVGTCPCAYDAPPMIAISVVHEGVASVRVKVVAVDPEGAAIRVELDIPEGGRMIRDDGGASKVVEGFGTVEVSFTYETLDPCSKTPKRLGVTVCDSSTRMSSPVMVLTHQTSS